MLLPVSLASEAAMLKGKTAVVTGSTSGIGLGIAEALAKKGANIVLNGFGDKAEIERLRARLTDSCKVNVAYDSAKHGLAGLTKTVALEAAEHGITVNAICPGYVWTPLVEKQIPDTAKARGMTEEQVKRDVLLAAQPTKKFVAVEEVAELAVFLASDAAASITGALLSIDGGWTAQ